MESLKSDYKQQKDIYDLMVKYQSKTPNKSTLKFEGKNIDDINKKIALLELYEKTSNAYDKGIRIDKEEFKRKEIEKSYLKVNKD